MTNAMIAHGIVFTWDSVAISEVRDVTGIAPTRNMIPIKSNESADQYVEYLAGLKEGGDVTITCLYDYTDSTGQVKMVADYEAGTEKTASISYPTTLASSWSFSGIISNITPVGDSSDGGDHEMLFSVTIKITGKPTFAVASA